MKYARNRLGNLLNGIRNGDINVPVHGRGDQSPVDVEEEDDRRGRPGRKRRERRVVFELRGKPFGLRDANREEAVFSLCRTWMRGKEDDLKEEPDFASLYHHQQEESLDLLATKEIYTLPRPFARTAQDVPLAPSPRKKPRTPASQKLDDPKAVIANDFMPHWRSIKRTWCDHSKLRERRFARSVQLLETVFGIAQQNQLMT